MARTPKKAAKRAVGAKKRKPTAAGAQGTISIRMYRGLLGDFFLIMHRAGGRTFKMLIDCGVLQCIGTKAKKPSTSLGKARIAAGVVDLMRDINGELDLMVATHEHYDHLSGFILANSAFKPLRIHKVWMAWTEDRNDKVANGYRSKKDKALSALVALTGSPALAATSEKETITNLLQFYGGAASIRSAALAVAGGGAGGAELAGNASCEAVLDWLRRRAGAGNVSFLIPGQAVRWGLDDAFRAYVLGPPRKDERLRKLDPSSGEQREVYLARGEDVETVHGLAAIHGNQAGPARLEDQPFARPYWRPYGPKRSGKLKDPIVRLYRATDRASRIDNAWLGSVEDLALKIDGDVNNTSLALAFELPSKKVLLFPADAQVGNWLSWGDQTYPADDTRDGAREKVDGLLARTILYKVGHHASHNATLRERGLELMTDPDLCAMIPVVEKTAKEQKTANAKGGWAMPYGDLFERLTQRTKARILRGDGDTAVEKSKFKKAPFTLTYGPDFSAKDPLWVELTLTL